MNPLMKITTIFLVLSISYAEEINFIEINSYGQTEFNVNENQVAYFKYKLGKTKGPIGLYFHIANLYTVEVSVYKNIEEEPILTYFLAEKQFNEFDSSSFDDYAYIIIKETYKYYYKDYLTVYDPNEIVTLKPNEPFIINKFLSNNKFQMEFTSSENVTLVYNTFNTPQNQRKITILLDEQVIVEKAADSEYKSEFLPGTLYIIVENVVDGEVDAENLAQDFSLVVYENKKVFGFNALQPNEITKTKYIYNSEKQDFYYYVDISNYEESNTINFKLFFNYYLFKNNTEFYTNIIYLDKEITDADLENPDAPIHYVVDDNGEKVINTETGKYLIYDYVSIPIIEIFDNDETHTLFPWFADS
jgi:hypothetical protein